MTQEPNTRNMEMSFLHKWTLAVKKFKPELPEKDKSNSYCFVKFIAKLRRQETVAILGSDKYGRVGILLPLGMMAGEDFQKENFAITAYIGDLKRMKALFSTLEKTSHNPKQEPTTAHNAAKAPPSFFEQTMSTTDLTLQLTNKKCDDSTNKHNSNKHLLTHSDKKGNDDDNDCLLAGKKRKADSGGGAEYPLIYHENAGAAAAAIFYDGLTRKLDTRSESRLFHMRAFNGWVKATQIQELNPKITILPQKKSTRKNKTGPSLRVLDLACGKGGDLGKWILHTRGIQNYVGIDVALGSLKDAAVRARQLGNKLLSRCTFTCADLGADVPGRYKSKKLKSLQKLLTWSLDKEKAASFSKHSRSTTPVTQPEFHHVPGGGISLQDKFDVVSIQFAIHYMMQTRQRARRFFRTVSDLLEVGGNLIATTIDARIVVEKIMNLGEDLFSKDNSSKEAPVVVETGGGACRITFQRDVAQKIFASSATGTNNSDNNDMLFGLEYTFTLVEGSDHASGVGEAVDLPEWLIPLPVLKSLAEEAGMELEYCHNFHEFFELRKDPQVAPAAHLALSNMKVLNRNGSISKEEWEISRLYCAVKFRKVREPVNYALED